MNHKEHRHLDVIFSISPQYDQKKHCVKCGFHKPLYDYYRQKSARDGHTAKCKECIKHDVSKYRNENIEKIREHDRNRNMLPHRIASREAYKKTDNGRCALNKAKKAYIDRYPERKKETISSYNKRFPEKRAARTTLQSHIVTGKISRPTSCQMCGCLCVPHGHHEDYSKPLDVMWLCVQCHAKRHIEIKQNSLGSHHEMG